MAKAILINPCVAETWLQKGKEFLALFFLVFWFFDPRGRRMQEFPSACAQNAVSRPSACCCFHVDVCLCCPAELGANNPHGSLRSRSGWRCLVQFCAFCLGQRFQLCWLPVRDGIRWPLVPKAARRAPP